MSICSLVIGSISPGSSVQDRGRFGGQRYGLTPSGAVDLLSLAAANCLLGNEPFAAAVEIGPLPAALTARGGHIRLALTGASRPVEISGRALAPNRSFTLHEDETLTLGMARSGAFSYLAVTGGIPGTPMFGSLSVNGRAGLGAPFQRPLKSGDALTVNPGIDGPGQQITLPPPSVADIHVVMGPQDDEFSDEAKRLFLDSEWRISAISDRMGYRLEGPAITHLYGHNIVSDGTVTGSIQVPGNGQPIVLLPDRGTSGGYPKIATVISADVGRFGQLQAGSSFRFKAVSVEEAQRMARGFAELLNSLPGLIHSLDAAINLEALQSANIGGTAINAWDAVSWQVNAPQIIGTTEPS